MTQHVNPYDHLPTAHLKVQLTKLSRHMTKLAIKGKQTDMFEENRTIMLTISDALERRKEIEALDTLVNEDPAP